MQADVVAVDLVHVVIICPFCGKFHRHGSCGSITDTNYGTRVPHCTGDDRSRFGGEYELVTTPSTIRRKKLRVQDIKAWENIQRSKRADLEEQWRAKEAEELDAKILAAVRSIHASGGRLDRWKIALRANATERAVTLWMHQHGIYYGSGRYRAISRARAGPELSKIFGWEASG
ncbi:MAG TPA: hypothetical protein PKL48_10710 [Thermodesulfobacteriota bacterium]|nr:hypothetical protein [Thermodesulfobacteriota bacterium]